MTKLDTFESAFRSADKPVYEFGGVELARVLVVTDTSDAESTALIDEVRTFLSVLGESVTAHVNNQLSLQQGGFDNPAGGGFTSLRINAVGTGPVSIRHAELRRSGDVANVHVDPAGTIWVSLVKDGGLIPEIQARFARGEVAMRFNGLRLDYDFWLSELSRLPWLTVEAYDPESILLYGVRGLPPPLGRGILLDHQYGEHLSGRRIR